jgi:hypothetical protein
LEYNLIKVISNKYKIKIDDTEGGEGDNSSDSADDESVLNMGIILGIKE